jgi:hypothetical protein
MMNDYKPEPLPIEDIELERELLELVERLAEHAHDTWAFQRMSEGWTFGPERCDESRRHPCLVPYSNLEETEKVYDRKMVLGTIRAIIACGFLIQQKPPNT